MDEFNYGVHIVEAIGGLLGTGAKSVAFTGRSAAEGKAAETFHISYTGGESATFTTFEGNWMPFYMVIMTTTGTFCFMIETGAIYKALLDRICDFMESGKNRIAPITALTESVKIMLAGRISREQKGKRIQISDIPPDDPGYDGYAFEKAYAAKAGKIYLEE